MKTAALALAFIGFASTSLAQDPLSAALSKGIVEEDVNHNLDAAIKVYQAIVERFTNDRQVAATALYRLAECYRKLGKTAEANASYQQLLAQFPEQSALIEKSRRQIIAMPSQPDRETLMREQRERAILEEKLSLAQVHLRQVQRNLELGAGSTTDLDEAQIAVLQAQSDILTLDITHSIPPRQVVYRNQRRMILEQAVEVGKKVLAAEEKMYQIGAASTQDIARCKSKLLDLQLAMEIAGR